MTGEDAPGRTESATDEAGDPSVDAETATGWTRPDRAHVRYFHEFTHPLPVAPTPPPARPAEDRVPDEGDRDGETVGVSFLPWPSTDAAGAVVGRGASAAIRLALAHSQVVVLLAAAALVAYGAVSPAVSGVGVFLPPVVLEVLDLLVAEALLWVLLAGLLGWLFASGEADQGAETGRLATAKRAVALLWPFVVYGGLVVLAAGTAVAVHLVATNDPQSLPPNVVYASGFLLLLYIGGPLVYDGLLRTEVLFERLHRTGLVTDDQAPKYRQFREGLGKTLGSHVAGLPTAQLIAVGFVAQFGAMWLEGAGPFNLGVLPTLAFVLVVDVVIVLVAVQFLVLVKFLNELLDDETGASVSLVYRPAHEDGAGGFNALGQFATRVNTLLLLSGAYLLVRLHVQGLRDPLSPLAGGVGAGEALLWTLSYALPVTVYGVVMAVWVYFSFWQIHRKMVREKGEYIREQTESPERADPEDLERWEAFENAPEWPIRYRLLVTIVSLDVVSVLLSTFSLV